MLRPERMSRVSVTGSKSVLDEVIDTVHGLKLLHVTEYDGSWDGFEPGAPEETADDASDKLVTVRSLQSILDVTEEDAGPTRIVTDEALEEELESIRTQANDLDDERDRLESELRNVEEQIDTMEPFVSLGIDLDLLQGYDSLAVSVGEGDSDSVEQTLANSDVGAYKTYSEDGVVAAFAYTDEETLSNLLVDATFAELEVPDAEGSPEEHLESLRHEKQKLESNISTTEDELEDLRLEYGGFLLAAEEKLAIEVQKAEAPLTFATTENAFVAEGWLPADEFDRFESTIREAVGEAVDVDRLETATRDSNGHTHSEDHGDAGGHEQTAAHAAADAGADADEESDETPTAREEGEPKETVADGGLVTMGGTEPPTQQKNVEPAEPFELLTKMVGLPSYDELDPTFAIMLTFPVFFGFMIGDLGYGLLYTAAGFAMTTRFDNDAIKALGGIGMWAGVFTAIFGVLYGEIFGLHVIGEWLFGGSPPMHKGLQPKYATYGQTWLFASLLAGLAHLTLGYLFGVVNDIRHGVTETIFENVSWLVMMLGVWLWILSTQAASSKPDFLFTVLGSGEKAVYALGFTGFPEVVGTAGIGMFAGGLVVMSIGEYKHMGGPGLLVGPLESVNVLVNVLSYLRIAAVLLAKAGMAFVVNLLFFGVYTTGHEGKVAWHFGLTHSPNHMLEQGTAHGGHEVTGVIFNGLMHAGPLWLLVGVVILIVGHITVLLLGITSAGLQGIRLEYVEFFDKFYDGDGTPFDPFGYERNYTTDNQ